MNLEIQNISSGDKNRRQRPYAQERLNAAVTVLVAGSLESSRSECVKFTESSQKPLLACHEDQLVISISGEASVHAFFATELKTLGVIYLIYSDRIRWCYLLICDPG